MIFVRIAKGKFWCNVQVLKQKKEEEDRLEVPLRESASGMNEGRRGSLNGVREARVSDWMDVVSRVEEEPAAACHVSQADVSAIVRQTNPAILPSDQIIALSLLVLVVSHLTRAVEDGKRRQRES